MDIEDNNKRKGRNRMRCRAASQTGIRWRCPSRMLVAIVSMIWKGEGDQSKAEQYTIRGEIRLLWSTTNELKGKEDQGLGDCTQSIKQLNMLPLCQRSKHKDLLPTDYMGGGDYIFFYSKKYIYYLISFKQNSLYNWKLKYILKCIMW